MNNNKLKLGILLDSYYVPAWFYRSLERIVHSSYAEFSLIILYENVCINSTDHLVRKNKESIIYQIFNAIDEKLFLRNENASELIKAKDLFPGIPVIKANLLNNGNSDYFEQLDIDKIRSCELDILIYVNKQEIATLQGDILSASKYGVWSYKYEGYPQGFWEVVESQSESRTSLQILGEGPDNERTLFLSASSTYPFSPARNRNRILWISSSFLPRQIAILHSLGEKDYFDEIKKYCNGNKLLSKKQHKTPPSNLLSLWLITKLIVKIVYEVFCRLYYLDAWFLMIDFNVNISLPPTNFKAIIPPKGKFWADPMIIEKDDRYYVFMEEYTYKDKKGHISVIEVDLLGNYTAPVQVLDKAYHLSYPCVFESNDQYYLIPESADNSTIDLYQCVEFPWKWEFKMCLMKNIKAVDTTMFYYQGKWWLFTGIAENEGFFPEVELFLFFSDTIYSNEWHAHPKNPIVSNVNNARPGGKIFTKEGNIYRPSQDGSKTYGYGINLNKILVLTETEYKEEKVISIIPNWDKKVSATHTYGSEGKLNIVDAYMRRHKFF